MDIIFSLWNYDISSTVVPLLTKEQIISCDFNICKKTIDNSFCDISDSTFLLSHRFKLQKLGENCEDIERCTFYNEIIQLNNFILQIELYCSTMYNAIIVNTNDEGIAHVNYSINNLFVMSDNEYQEKKDLINLILSDRGYSEQAKTEIVNYYHQKDMNIVSIFEIHNIAKYTGNYKRLDNDFVLIGTDNERKLLENHLQREINFQSITCFLGSDEITNDIKPEKYSNVIILHPIYKGILRKLWMNGYSIESNVFMPQIGVFTVKSIMGEYKDIFGNYIKSNSKNARFDLSGYGAYAKTEDEILGYIIINLGTLTNACFEADIKAEIVSIGLLYGSRLNFGKGTTIDKKNTIRMGPFTEFICGHDCKFEKEVYVIAGDGHSIFNIINGQRTNYLPTMLDTDKLKVVFGNNVKVGAFSTIIAGCNIGDNCCIDERSLVNKKVGKDLRLGGVSIMKY